MRNPQIKTLQQTRDKNDPGRLVVDFQLHRGQSVHFDDINKPENVAQPGGDPFHLLVARVYNIRFELEVIIGEQQKQLEIVEKEIETGVSDQHRQIDDPEIRKGPSSSQVGKKQGNRMPQFCEMAAKLKYVPGVGVLDRGVESG